MKYLVLLFRAEDSTECEFYWTDDLADAEDMCVNPEYHSATLVTTASVDTFDR
jgi:hypothetical protein